MASLHPFLGAGMAQFRAKSMPGASFGTGLRIIAGTGPDAGRRGEYYEHLP
jgi:hypothetical protein